MRLGIDDDTKSELNRIINHLGINQIASIKEIYYGFWGVPDYSEYNKFRNLQRILIDNNLAEITNPNENPIENVFNLRLTNLGRQCKSIEGYIKYLEEQAALKQSTQPTPIINNHISGSSGVQVVNGSINGSQLVNTNPTSVVNETKEVETKPKSKNIEDYIKDFFSSTIVKIVAGIVGAAVLAYLGFK